MNESEDYIMLMSYGGCWYSGHCWSIILYIFFSLGSKRRWRGGIGWRRRHSGRTWWRIHEPVLSRGNFC